MADEDYHMPPEETAGPGREGRPLKPGASPPPPPRKDPEDERREMSDLVTKAMADVAKIREPGSLGDTMAKATVGALADEERRSGKPATESKTPDTGAGEKGDVWDRALALIKKSAGSPPLPPIPLATKSPADPYGFAKADPHGPGLPAIPLASGPTKAPDTYGLAATPEDLIAAAAGAVRSKKYRYEALTYDGKDESGEVEADSESDAHEKLKKKGLIPTKVREHKPTPPGDGGGGPPRPPAPPGGDGGGGPPRPPAPPGGDDGGDSPRERKSWWGRTKRRAGALFRRAKRSTAAKAAVTGYRHSAEWGPGSPSNLGRRIGNFVGDAAGVGRTASALVGGGAAGAVLGPVVAIGAAFYKAGQAIDDWTKTTLESQKALSNVSGSMAAVFAQREMLKMVRDQELGEATAGSAKDLVEAEDRREKAGLGITKALTNVGNRLLAWGNDALGAVLDPLSKLAEATGLADAGPVGPQGLAKEMAGLKGIVDRLDREAGDLMDIAAAAAAKAGGMAGAAPDGALKPGIGLGKP